MVSEDPELQGFAATALVPDWLQGLIRTVQREGLQPRDARVKSLWDLLQHRQLLGRSRWLPVVLRRIWSRGLTARPHPRTAQRFERLLQSWGILLPVATSQMGSPPTPIRPLRWVTARAVQLVAVQPIQARTMQPMTSRARRP